jgi:hypothetical protein
MIRIEGKNILDEGFSGRNARDMDTGRMTREGAEKLVDSVRTAINPGKSKLSSNNPISAVSSLMAKNLGENTEAVQKIVESQGDETKKELTALISKMAAAQTATGKQSVSAIKELIKQVERVKLAAGEQGEDLAKNLGLDTAQKTLAKGISRSSVTGSVWRKLMKTDEGLGFKDSFKQAFTLEKMFGLKPSANKIIQQQKDILNEENIINNQNTALNDIKETLIDSPASVDTKNTAKESSPASVDTKNTAKERVVTVGNISSSEKTAEGGPAFQTTIDRESPDNKQVELLEQILKQLKKMESFGSSSGFNLPPVLPDMPDIDVDGPDSNNRNRKKPDKKPSRWGRIGRIAKGVGTAAAGVVSSSVLAIAATVAAPIALGVYLAQKNSNPLPDGPERTIRGPGGRERTTTAPLSRIERQNMEEYGTIDREEIQKIQMERAGYTQPEVVQSSPITQLSSSDIKEKQKNNPALIEAVKNMSESQRESFLQINPHMRSVVEAQSEALENPRQSTEPDMLTIPGSGVLSPESQGMTPQVTPTGDAVSNMTEAYGQMLSNVTNIFNNTTNNNGSGPQPQPILVSPSSVRNNDSSFRFYQQGQNF